ncbi:capsule assembly Wzi family protein [Flavihumibacter sp. R14]|nr:capsule assembly Wzi family protein [Flavihumibacter soli]
MLRIRIFALILMHSFILSKANAQSIPVGMPVLEDVYRRAQLLGKIDSSISFTIRPFSPGLLLKDSFLNVFDLDSMVAGEGSYIPVVRGLTNNKGTLIFRVLPLSWQQQYNSALPYGWNDGEMIPSKGYQTKMSAGVFFKAGPLTIQVQPEYVYAVNAEFENSNPDQYIGGADIPVRFGEDAYSRLSWGESSAKLNAGPVSFGISNENLWWGPGRRNSLLLSNNARGFKHLTFNTNRPIQTPIGSFETQIIGGKLLASEDSPLNADSLYSDWRYLSSMAISYQPKWVPGLFLGFNRSFQVYERNIKNFGDYFPFFTPFEKSKDSANASGADEKDQLASVYARWLLPKAHAEIYLEYGVNDHSHNLRDFVMSPEHSRAYIFGFQKLIELKGKHDEYLQVSAEVTQMSQSIDRLVREAFAWYTHFKILQGYTHEGKVLGSGVGPGGNLQSVDVSWIKGLKSIGFQFERYVHNNDYYNVGVFDFNGQSRRWIDLGFAATGTWNFKNLLVNAKLQGIQSMNYQWTMKNYAPDVYYIPENDIFNVHAELGMTYRF